ncbi:hypothetical protein EDB83DRAFT_879732 [Lactarius deliciosus]|nr:hypothetical protein EDB83DRAFT_879732 [Lactarius deliciosus]
MPRRTRRRSDPERGEQIPLDTRGREMNNSSDGNTDFDDGANALWSLYSKEAQTHDEALFKGLLGDMNGIPTFAGLFAAVLTSFLVDSLKNLQPDPAQQSVYYQQQSVAMLSQISQQIASIAPQVSVSSTPPPPYPDFSPSDVDIWTNAYWLAGLIFSLSAAAFCDSRSSVGSILYAGLPTARSPSEASTVSTIFFRRRPDSAGVCVFSHLDDPYLALPIFFGPAKRHTHYQHSPWQLSPFFLWLLLYLSSSAPLSYRSCACSHHASPCFGWYFPLCGSS